MNCIDVNQELKIIENSLRDIISFALNIKYGHDWLNQLKVSKDKINSWKDKMTEEKKRFRGTLIDNRLIYYSEFHDLYTIINNHWDDIFKDIFIDKKQTEVMLDIISSYRISIAHNRELKDHQKHFLVGVSGIIRHLITEYKADRDNEDSYYPKFKNIFINDIDIVDVNDSIKLYNKNYHVDDEIEVIVNVGCPPDVTVTYAIIMNNDSLFKFKETDFSSSNRKIFKLSKDDIPCTNIHIAVKSDQYYHRYNKVDLSEEHSIKVLPNK